MSDLTHPLRADHAALENAALLGPVHLRPIAMAVRLAGCDFALIPQGAGPFNLARGDRPLIALLGDDLHAAQGPGAFDADSLRKLIARATVATVISSGPDPEPYRRIVNNAVLLRQDVVIVETRPEREIEWVNLLRDVNPEIGVLICSVKEGQA